MPEQKPLPEFPVQPHIPEVLPVQPEIITQPQHPEIEPQKEHPEKIQPHPEHPKMNLNQKIVEILNQS